ncbi:MAG TPA: hypothetical protein VM533_20195, partial [Fimbriiglobus sp.]|nr:hypothetical protein [Fimbriiglobus sp.]
RDRINSFTYLRFSRDGAYLSPAAGTTPGYYVKPYIADAYYRIEPATRTATWDGSTQFGEPAPVTEGEGFREWPQSRG